MIFTFIRKFLVCWFGFWAVVIVASFFYLEPHLGWILLSLGGELALYGLVIGLIISLPGMLWRWWRRSRRLQ